MSLALIVISVVWIAIAFVLNLIFQMPAGLIILITFLATSAISLVVLDHLGSGSWGEHALPAPPLKEPSRPSRKPARKNRTGSREPAGRGRKRRLLP